MSKSKTEFNDIHDRFHAKIHRYLERMVGEDEAEDLTSEIKRTNSIHPGPVCGRPWRYAIAEVGLRQP